MGTEVLSPQERQQYKAQGYTDAEIAQAEQEALREESSSLQQSYQQALQQQSTDPRQFASNTLISGLQNQDNLIKWQLELDSILERVEHMLRGDKPEFINGNLIFVPPKDPKHIVLNDFGVSEIMRVLSMYVNRNTILSNYDEDTINWKVFDFGNEITDLFYLKYESMGLGSLEKRKLYPILVRELVDFVHSAYLRALHGGERTALREARQVTQSEIVNPMMQSGQMPGQRGILSKMMPWNWGKK